MKTKLRIFRVISCLLTIVILGQSCTIYRSAGISVDEAVESQNKVRVKTKLNQNYIFKRLEKDTAGVYGIADQKSRPARELSHHITSRNLPEYQVKIKLQEDSIKEIKPRDKTLSIVVPAGIVAAGIILFALTFNASFSPFPDGI
ncbi:MAG TPA: hypothetical protein VK941_08055 [Gillisia sp.]|nr:hypothetical protein [Gillisia sp.]